jgi:uncharacterized protein YdhG (YjbR/CyaY superfamily)
MTGLLGRGYNDCNMPATRASPQSVDEYIASFPPDVRSVLQSIRSTIKNAAPHAEETISYKMPAFKLEGRTIMYFAAFQRHIGVYPPVRGNASLQKAVSRYAGDKGNLKFLLDRPVPYKLIERIVKFRICR